jgi:CubicO group peptidase (beta-lactamase class C family)
MPRPFLLIVLALPWTGHAQVDSAQRLLGVWGAELTVGSLVGGQLTIDGRGQPWRAQIGGFDVAIERKGSELSFALPGDAGEFRGRLRADGQRVDGSWIQPATLILSNRYATHLALRTIAARVWRGSVDPLAPRISFYMFISRGDDGTVSARIRNPEFGWAQRGAWTVHVRGLDVIFARAGSNFQRTGTLDSTGSQLTAPLIDGAPPVVLTRRGGDDALGFYSRSPRVARYQYHEPVPDGDGWTTASLGDIGIDTATIAALVERILAGDPTDDAVAMQSLLIARHGKLVLEEYFHGFSKDRPHDMRSASKTFAPMLVGLARDRGATVKPETPVYAFLSEYKPFANWDERKEKMQVKDLMSMTAGFDCDEDHSDTAVGNEDVMQSQTAQPDWYKYTLDVPMAYDPGTSRASYCSADLNLAGGVARKASGQWLPELFDAAFASPLQFGRYYLNLMPTGEAYMGGGAYIRARDQLKLGQLYLNGGTWNGRRVIDRDWVERSLAVYGKFEDRFGVDHQYGWGWHISHLTVGGRTLTEYVAGGNGGQVVLFLPALDMVIGFTGSAYGDFRAWGPWSVQLVPQSILPAVKH